MFEYIDELINRLLGLPTRKDWKCDSLVLKGINELIREDYKTALFFFTVAHHLKPDDVHLQEYVILTKEMIEKIESQEDK